MWTAVFTIIQMQNIYSQPCLFVFVVSELRLSLTGFIPRAGTMCCVHIRQTKSFILFQTVAGRGVLVIWSDIIVFFNNKTIIPSATATTVFQSSALRRDCTT